MAEPGIVSAGAAATGLTLFGVATGLDPAILIAGFAGGAWAQSYHPPAPIWKRVFLTVLAAILAGYLAPAGASIVMSAGVWQGAFTVTTLQLPVAVIVGLISHRILGPAIMKLSVKKLQEASE